MLELSYIQFDFLLFNKSYNILTNRYFNYIRYRIFHSFRNYVFLNDVVFFFSFQICYEQEFQEPLPVDDLGVPLEHLISCVSNIEIRCVGPNKNIKVIKFSETQNGEETGEGKLTRLLQELICVFVYLSQ